VHAHTCDDSHAANDEFSFHFTFLILLQFFVSMQKYENRNKTPKKFVDKKLTNARKS